MAGLPSTKPGRRDTNVTSWGLIGNAMSDREIARHLKISDHTVKTHLHHIYVKLENSGRHKALLPKTAA